MIRRETLTSRVFDHLIDKIKSGEFRPGDRLPTEKELTESLGVSRTCVREAVKSLQALRLISVRAAVGAVVLEPTPAAWFNADLFAAAIHAEKKDTLIEFRKVLEVGLVSLAAEKADHMDILSLSKSIAAYENALALRELPFQADVDFHTAVVEASKNPIGAMVWRTIVQPLTEQLRAANTVPNAAEEGLHDHLKIFSAITERSPERARNAMRAHLENAERYWLIANSGLPSQEISAPAAAEGALAREGKSRDL